MADADDTHEGSRWVFPIREGLVCAQHYHAMGDALWLYLYLHKHAGFKTGIVPRYHHADAAAELDTSERTVKRYMRRLERGCYVHVTRGWNRLRVEILRYQPHAMATPEPREVTDVSSQSAREVTDVSSQSSSARERSDTSVTSEVPHMALAVLHTVLTVKDEGCSSVAGAPAREDAAAAAAEPSTDVSRLQDAVLVRAVAVAILEAQGRRVSEPAVTRMEPAVLAEVIEPYRGRATLAQVRGCLAYLSSKPQFADKPHILSPRILGEDLAGWIAAREPVRYAEPVRSAPQAGPRRTADGDPATVFRSGAVLCDCRTLEGYPHETVLCGLTGRVTKDNYREQGRPWILHTAQGVSEEERPDHG